MRSYDTIVLFALLALCLSAFRWPGTRLQVTGTSAQLGNKLDSIQAARGFAALLVVLYHFPRLLQHEQYLGYVAFDGAFAFGHSGVDFFFVLSGFIIYYVHHVDLGQPTALRSFAWRRASRVYPLYWFVTALTILSVALVAPDWTSRFDLAHVVASLLLLPQSTDPVLGVGWTLLYEALFYALFAVGIASRRAGLAVVMAWLALIAVGLYVMPTNPPFQLLTSSFNLLFLFGIVAAHVVLTMAVPRPRLVALLGLCAFLGIGYAENTDIVPAVGLAGRLLYGVASAVIIVGLATAERAGHFQVRREAVFLGNISYALYLIHVPLTSNMAWLLSKLGVIAHIPAVVLAIGAVTGSIVAATILHLWIERPLLRLRLGGSAHNLPIGRRQRSI